MARELRSPVPAGIPSRVAASRRPGRAMRVPEGSFAWLMVAPAVGAIVVVVAIPLAYSLWLSFTDVNLLRMTGPAESVFTGQVDIDKLVFSMALNR